MLSHKSWRNCIKDTTRNTGLSTVIDSLRLLLLPAILTFKMCTYHNIPYLANSDPSSNYYKKVNKQHRHNVWILAIGNNNPITPQQVQKDLKDHQIKDKDSPPITIIISKRDPTKTPTTLHHHWTASNQIRIAPKADFMRTQ